MARALLLLGLVALSAALPPVQKTRQEIDDFRKFLEGTQKEGGGGLPMTPISTNVNAEEVSGKFEGDIILDDFQIEAMVNEFAAGRNAYTWPNTHWPNNVVVWEFGEEEFGPLQSAAIEEGIADIEKHTCVKFRYREPEDTVFVRVTGRADGCYAHVGYWQSRGVHTLNLARNNPGEGCFRHTTIVHEWLHILGFLHMQSTHNRDNYVRIVPENIQPGTMNNFDIYSEELVSNLDVPYDYVSCMHYGAYAFSVNGQATIVALNEHEGLMGQREFIPESDWVRLRRHYECPNAWN